VDSDNPLAIAGLIVAVGALAKWWHDDLRANRIGSPNPSAMPGATDAPARAHLIGVTGAIAILGLEIGGEQAMGISASQSRVTVLFSVYTLAAAFGEELVFRGYLVVPNRGQVTLIACAVLASVAFGLLHPFLWSWEEGHFSVHNTTKAWWSTAMAIAGSLWFYFVRFMPANPHRSLLPCVSAHAAKNLGVFAAKLATGHVAGWW
jgi:membrane protease YdiL (CAAX protease family)